MGGLFEKKFHGFCPSQNPLKATKNGDVKRTTFHEVEGVELDVIFEGPALAGFNLPSRFCPRNL